MQRIRSGAFWAVGMWALAAGALAAQGPYAVLDHWKIGGTGGWDYVTGDPAAHRLYITHGPRVEVLDTQTGKPVGALTGFKNTHGVALDNRGRYGYISDGGSNAVAVFDRKSLAVVMTIPAGTNPDGIVFDPSSDTVWAFNGRSSNATVIDINTNTVVAAVAVPGKPEFPVSDGRGAVYDNIESANEIVRFDTTTKQLTATWKLRDCESPSGLAMDREHRRLFAVCDGGRMAVVDANTGKQLASPAIGEGPDATRFSTARQLVFSSNGASGTLTVVDAANGYKVLQTLPTAKGARTMEYDESADRVYVVTAKLGPTPPASVQAPHPRPAAVPDSFEVLVIGRKC